MDEKDQKSQKEDEARDDNSLWEHITRDITPLDNSKIHHHTDIKHTSQKDPKQTAQTETIPFTPPPKSNEVDRQTARRLKRGQIPIEGRLDLHGMTQTQAHDALNRIIPKSYGQKKRCLLIITGKGTRRSSEPTQKSGILKQKVPEWLNEPPLKQFVLRIQTAHIKDGGEGALYVYLRRQRGD